jgi:hypothetical protein
MVDIVQWVWILLGHEAGGECVSEVETERRRGAAVEVATEGRVSDVYNTNGTHTCWIWTAWGSERQSLCRWCCWRD